MAGQEPAIWACRSTIPEQDVAGHIGGNSWPAGQWLGTPDLQSPLTRIQPDTTVTSLIREELEVESCSAQFTENIVWTLETLHPEVDLLAARFVSRSMDHFSMDVLVTLWD